MALLAPTALPRSLHVCVGSHGCGLGPEYEALSGSLTSNLCGVAAASACMARYNGWDGRRSQGKECEARIRLGSWQDSCGILEAWRRRTSTNTRQKCRLSQLVVKAETKDEDNFEDVDKHLLDYFTYKAVRTVLVQLHEMNPAQYVWFYNFVVANKPMDGKNFLRILVKDRLELGERVMVTRLHLFGKWTKKYNHAKMHEAIKDQNLELLRERLSETVKFSGDGEDIERPPLKSK